MINAFAWAIHEFAWLTLTGRFFESSPDSGSSIARDETWMMTP